jgi:hypothetical protein
MTGFHRAPFLPYPLVPYGPISLGESRVVNRRCDPLYQTVPQRLLAFR